MNDRESDQFDRVHKLVTPHVMGHSTKEENEDLQRLVKSDSGFRREYVRYMQELYHIASRLSLSPPGPSDPSHTTSHESRHVDSSERVGVKVRGFGTRAAPRAKLLGFVAVSAALLVAFFVSSAGGPEGSRDVTTAQRGSPVGPAQSSTDESGGAAMDTGESPARKPSRVEVATLVCNDDAVWDDLVELNLDLTRLAIGEQLRLVEGQANVFFDAGVEVLMIAPCEITLLEEKRISSNSGRISARVIEGGRGFTIDTPVARVVDLGTEFAVSISESGETDVAVFEGEVDLAFGSEKKAAAVQDPPRRDRLVQGQALRINRSGESSRIASIDNRRLPGVRQLPPVFDRPPLISEVRDNISDRDPAMKSFYRIVHSGLREDSQAFVDRVHEWNGVGPEGFPGFLIGADYVLPFNDDKFADDLKVQVSVARPAVVYVFLSDNVDVPDWLRRDFVDTQEDIGLDEGPNRFRPSLSRADGPGNSVDTVFSIWRREVHEPEVIALGAIERPSEDRSNTDGPRFPGYNMYGIAVVEQ